MTTIALATSSDLPGLVADDASFLDALRDRGVTATPVVWTDDVDWDGYDGVVVRSIWDYYKRPDEFDAWVDTLAAVSCPVFNPPAMLRWNSHKFYLRDLSAAGIPTLPTEYVEQGGDISLPDVFERHDWAELVVKPAVSAGAYETKRIARADAGTEQPWVDSLLESHDILVQEYAETITTGEWSLLFFDGEYSHAVVKRPEDGDFRVQSEHGGTVHRESPSAELRAQARRVVEAVADRFEVPLYARVDGVERNGTFQLIEVELIEPELFFRTDDDAAVTLTSAVLDRL